MSIWLVVVVVLACAALLATTGLFLAIVFDQFLRPALKGRGARATILVAAAVGSIAVTPMVLGFAGASERVALATILAVTVVAIGGSVVVLRRTPPR